MKRYLFLCATISLSIFSLGLADEEKKIESETEADLITLMAEDQELEPTLIAAANNVEPPAPGHTAIRQFGPDDPQFVDPKVLRDFVESRGLIACRQKEGTLTLAADVRARWIATGEKVNGKSVRGAHANVAVNVFKSEVNLFLDYVAPKTWVSTKLKWSAVLGVDGGTITKTDLDRAFIGYDVYECKCRDFYIEVGRSKLDYLFESKVEFSTFFDGLHFYYTDKYDNIGVFTLHGGPFIVDSFTNHYAWVFETGMKKLGGTGYSVKYSLIDWNRHAPTLNYGGQSTAGNISLIDNPRYRFIVSQLILGHEHAIDLPGCNTLYIYAAVLANHAAKKNKTTHFSYANKAWYVGFTLGKLCKACDWSLDINYQYVQAQALPEFDISGIGHGNANGFFLSDAIILGRIGLDAQGFTNYTGFETTLLYALTDSLTLRSRAAWSRQIDKQIGGTFRYKTFEMAVIYAF
jgi:hypothetical protein